MNTLDILIIVILAFSIIYSFSRGLIKELCSLCAIVIGLFIAAKTYLLVAKPLMEVVHNSKLARIIGFLIIFFLLCFTISLIGKGFRKLIKIGNLGWIDHIGGAILGLLKGIVIASIIVTLLVAFFSSEAYFIRTSKTKPFIVSLSLFLADFIPLNLKNAFNDKRDQIKEFWREKQSGRDKYTNSKDLKREKLRSNGSRSKKEKGVNWKISNKIRKEMI